MASLDVVPVVLSGFPGGPGVSTFYFDNTATYDLTDLHDLYGLLLGLIPSNTTITLPTSGVTISDDDGELIGAWTKAAVSAMAGSNTGDYAGGVGATIRWETGAVAHGHAVRGRTYMVPLANAAFDTDGTLKASERALLQSSADTTIAAYGAAWKVWHRPKTVATPGPNGGTHIGSAYTITAATIPDKAAMLRSRRD